MNYFPSFFAISANRYSRKLFMTCSDGFGPDDSRGLVFDPRVEVPSSKAKFAVEDAGNGLVHIRCCYNNKYWFREENPLYRYNGSYLVLVSLNEPVTDKSARNCTLFKPKLLGSNVSFTHVPSGYGLFCENSMFVEVVNGKETVFSIVDYELLVKLPKRVTFRGDNGKYLCGRWRQRHEYNEFSSNDTTDRATHYEIIHTNGTIRIKSLYFGKFWRRSPNWIWADSNDYTTNNLDTLFEVAKVGDNAISLRNQGNKYICKRLTTEGKKNCLNAAVSSLVSEARLFVEEPVYSRKIHVHFKLKDARIHSKTPLLAACVTVPNRTNRDHEVEQGFAYAKTKTNTWSTSSCLKLGVKTSINSKIPFISDGKIEISAEFSETVSFEESISSSQQLTSTYRVPVPAMTKATIKLLGSQAKYDIPFSYSQTDIYTSGETATFTSDDGLYSSVEAYDFYYDTKYEPL